MRLIANRISSLLLGRDVLEDIYQMVPELLYGGNQHTLIGRVNALQGRTKGDHIQMGIFIEEETTLQSGMDGLDLGLYAKQAFVALGSNLQNL